MSFFISLKKKKQGNDRFEVTDIFQKEEKH